MRHWRSWLPVIVRQGLCSRRSRGVPMPLYHFAVADRFPPQVADAVELPTIALARAHALRFAAQTLNDQLPTFWDADEWVLTVSDAERLTLFTITVLPSNAAGTAPTAKHRSASSTDCRLSGSGSA
ncbi:DUF6894 family protein [Sphingomonas sp. Leaf357]|uniref:DUF6894 family protein n=1 Tax=Sphingomonas sp. Leaf357 TaxID=1736350 RepID=UPI003FA6AD56